MLGIWMTLLASAFAEPVERPYWGDAVDKHGEPVTGTFDIDMALHQDDTVVFRDHFDDVEVSAGRFMVVLGSGTPIEHNAAGTLSITVGDVEQVPIELESPAGGIGGLIGANSVTVGPPPAVAPLPNAAELGPGVHLVGAPLWFGAIDESRAEAVVSGALDEMGRCLPESAQPRSGLVRYSVTIARDGDPSRVSVRSSTLGDPAVERCGTYVLERLHFPRPTEEGVVIVTYPLGFVLEGGAAPDPEGGVGGLIGDQGGLSGTGRLGERGDVGSVVFDVGPTLEGELDAAIVVAVFLRHRNQIRYCYQRQLSRDPSIAGAATFRFTVEVDGTATEAQVTPGGSLDNDAVAACIVGRIARMQFPESSGTTEVVYPLVFLSPGS